MEPSQIAKLLAEILERHSASLELYASQWTATPADSVQEAFIALATVLQKPTLQKPGLQKPGLQQSCTPIEHPIAWLYRTVRNQALNAARANRRRQHHERIAARLAERKHTSQMAMTEQLPLIEAVDALSADDRELVVLRIWSELTWQEIADLTDTSSSSAQRRYVAVLKTLRQHLEPSCLTNPN